MSFESSSSPASRTYLLRRYVGWHAELLGALKSGLAELRQHASRHEERALHITVRSPKPGPSMVSLRMMHAIITPPNTPARQEALVEFFDYRKPPIICVSSAAPHTVKELQADAATSEWPDKVRSYIRASSEMEDGHKGLVQAWKALSAAPEDLPQVVAGLLKRRWPGSVQTSTSYHFQHTLESGATLEYASYADSSQIVEANHTQKSTTGQLDGLFYETGYRRSARLLLEGHAGRSPQDCVQLFLQDVQRLGQLVLPEQDPGPGNVQPSEPLL